MRCGGGRQHSRVQSAVGRINGGCWLHLAGLVFPQDESCWLAVQGSWVTHYAAFVARHSPDGASVLTAAEVEGIPNGVKYLASIYWASTTILIGRQLPATHVQACCLPVLGSL